MKIDVPLCLFEIETHNSKPWHMLLWRDLWNQYSKANVQTDRYSHNQVLDHLPAMAIYLRQQGWKVYYWKDHPSVKVTGYPVWFESKMGNIVWANKAGLVFGPYCPNLTHWCLCNL